MAKDPIKTDEVIEVPKNLLVEMQNKQLQMEKDMEDLKGKNAGLEEMMKNGGGETSDKAELKMKKSFEPKFRTVRIRQYPMKGNVENLGFVIGWSNRGAYQKLDTTGTSPQMSEYLDVFFLGHERNDEGKLQAESIKSLDLINKGIQVHCKILDTKKEVREVPTNEEIGVTTWDPQHGLIDTGEKVDGYVAYTDTTYTIQVPGEVKPVVVDSKYVN
jgi:hypothetical protein